LGNQSREARLYRFPTRPLGEKKRLVNKTSFCFCASRKTNFLLTDRTLTIDFKNAWKILEKFNAEARSAEATNPQNFDFEKTR
jgi:hypothetical protein